MHSDPDVDPMIFVVTRVNWRNHNLEQPFLPQLPRLLSLLETLRGTKGVPQEIYLDSNEGVAVYLPTNIRTSDLPKDPKASVRQLMITVEESIEHLYSTMREVEDWFWRAARKKGFSPEIVEKMARGERHYTSDGLMQRFNLLLRKYFSIRFRIHRSESCLHVEAETYS
ncbi:MAG: hypothetical protein EAX95_15820 [Candidatus Thorarchaeota archaeon]|nr:hypothetical protein [Candidatus Thorarchaeota archaeon]